MSAERSFLRKCPLPLLAFLVLLLLNCQVGCSKVAVREAPVVIREVAILSRVEGEIALEKIALSKLASLAAKGGAPELASLFGEGAQTRVPVAKLGEMRLNQFAGVFTRGQIDAPLAFELHKSGVPLVYSLDEGIAPLFTAPSRVRVCFVGSPDKAALADLYGKEAVSPILEATQGPGKFGGLVGTREELKTQLKLAAASNETLALVFNNKLNNRIPFMSDPIPLGELDKHFGDTSRLLCFTCDSYTSAGLLPQTTGKLDTASVVKALRQTQAEITGTTTRLDFLGSFSERYRVAAGRRDIILRAKVAAGLTGLTGSVVVGVSKIPVPSAHQGQKEGKR